MASEHQEQCAVVDWFDMQYPMLCGRLFAVPNGGQRHIAVAVKLKAEGVRPGVPDLWLPVKMGEWSGLVIEMKSLTGKATREQAQWMDFLTEQGFFVVCCNGAGAAIRTIKSYLSGGGYAQRLVKDTV